MSNRILSISGLRGVVGDGLDPEYVVRFASAVGTMFHGHALVLARDGRHTGDYVAHAVKAALISCGTRVIDAGVSATPTCGVLIQELGAGGGLQITASHNPIEWNGLKPFNSGGSVFGTSEGERLLRLLESGEFMREPWDRLGHVESLDDSFGPHLGRILGLVDTASIKQRAFRVVLDCNHGSGAVGGPRLLRELGCEVIVLGGTPDGRFDHTPEPIESNLAGLCAAVKEHRADVGFAQDPDADRLAIVDETGRYIGEELTLALALEHVLQTRTGPVVVNGSTSRVNADIAARHGCDFFRSHVGEANVCALMQSKKAVIGGEGNGGVIEPAVGFVRDSFVSMAYVLASMAQEHQSVSGLVSRLPSYHIVKDKVSCDRGHLSSVCFALQSRFSDADATEGDGLRLDWPDKWVQVRASNTEPILRIIAEARTGDEANALCRQAREIVRKCGVTS